MHSSVEVDVADATALAGEDHFVLVLDEMNAAGIRVHEECAITATRPPPLHGCATTM